MLFWTAVLMRTFRHSLDPTLGDTVTELQVIVLCTFCRLVSSNHGTVIQHCCVMKRFCEQARPRRVASKVANKHAPQLVQDRFIFLCVIQIIDLGIQMRMNSSYCVYRKLFI